METNWFKVTISSRKVMENGFEKRVRENYLFRASSFTDAECRAMDYAATYGFVEYDIKSIKPANFNEVVLDKSEEADKLYHVVIQLIMYDEKSGKEKKMKQGLLIPATSIDDARYRMKDVMKDYTSDYTLFSIKESNLVEVITKTI